MLVLRKLLKFIPLFPALKKRFKLELNFKTWAFFVASLFIIGIGIYVLQQSKGAKAAWFDNAWSYRTAITFGNTGAADSNKKVKINMDTQTLIDAGKLQADCGDSRFTDSTGAVLQYYIDSANGPCGNQSGGVTGPTNIDNASDFGTLVGYTRTVVRTSSGTLYAFLNDGGSCEIWKSSDGSTWAEQDTADNPTCTSGRGVGAAIDSTDVIHLVYINGASAKYMAYTTSTDNFGAEEDVYTQTTGPGPTIIKASIAVDTGNKPHVAIESDSGSAVTNRYTNRVGGSWKATVTGIGGNDFGNRAMDITIDLDNKPIILSQEATGSDLQVYLGDVNDAASFSSKTVSSVDSGGANTSSSIAVDSLGNIWVAYPAQTTTYATLIKHNYGDAWATWQTPVTNSNASVATSIAINDTNIYIFYEDENDDIKYDSYNGSTWGGETNLHTGTFQDVRAKWSYLNNNGSVQIDYLYSDATDVYWASLPVGDGLTDYYVLMPNIVSGDNLIYHYYGNSSVLNGTRGSQFSQSTFTPTSGPTISSTEETKPGPSAYWKLDEGFGSTINDSVDGTDGTISGAVWQNEDTCISGKCLYFDGTNDTVDTGKDLYWSSTQAFSFSVWVNTKTSNSQTIFGKGTTGNFEYSLNLVGLDPQFRYWNSGGSSLISIRSTQSLTLNTWQNIAFNYDGAGTATLYIDGKVVKTQTGISGTFVDRANNINIGSGYFNAGVQGFFSGNIDELKFYNYARSAAEINSDLIKDAASKGSAAVLGAGDQSYLSDGLVGYWKMDEVGVSGSNWTAIDSSGNNNIATGTGNASVGTTALGKFGNAGYFDGGTDWLSLGSTLNMSLTHTATFWVNYLDAGDAVIIGNSASRYAAYIDGPASGDSIYYNPDPGAGGAVSVIHGGLTAGTWYHFAVVRNGNNVTFYKNGAQIGQTQTMSTNLPLYIGCIAAHCGGTAFELFGQLDEVRLYNRAFSPREVSQLYEWAPGPISYYKMDENAGTTINNVSGSGPNGTLATGTSAPLWTPGKYGSALAFDGVNDSVTIGSTMNNTAGTITAWVKTNVNGTNTIVSSSDEASTTRYFHFRLNGGVLSLGQSNNDTADSIDGNTVIPPGVWTHVAITSDGTSYKMYTNGMIQTLSIVSGSNSGDWFGDMANVDNFIVGLLRRTTDQYPMNGQLDEIKIYDYPLTQKQIISDMNAGHPSVGSPVGSSLGYWKLDEGYGTTVNNVGNAGSTLNGVFGTGTSAPTWSNSGKFGKALSFDGTSDYFTVGGTALNAPDKFTLSVWANPTKYTGNSQNQGFMVSKGAFPTYNYRLLTDGTSGNKFEVAVNVGSTGFLSLSTKRTFSTDKWYNVVGSYDGSNLKIYVDGLLDNNVAIGGTLNTNATSLYVGKYSSGVGYEYKGLLDEIKVYNYALSDNEVKVEFNRGKAIVLGAQSTGLGGTTPSNAFSRMYCVPGDSTSCAPPVGEWNFNEGVGNTMFDISTNSLHANMTTPPAPNWVVGKFGSALFFTGTHIANDENSGYGIPWVTDTTSSQIDLTSSLTFEAWIKPTSNAAYGDILGKVPTGYGTGYELANSSGTLRTILRNGGSTCDFSAGSLTTKVWQHVVSTYDGTTTKHYINGVLKGASTSCATGADVNNESLQIGNRKNDGHFVGIIDEVKIFNYPRTPAQVAWDYNKGGPLLQYKFDECQGDTIYNSAQTFNDSPAGNNGTIDVGAGGNTTLGTCNSGVSTDMWNDSVSGKYGSGLYFDGVDDVVNLQVGVSNVTSFLSTGQYSWSMWVKPTTGLGYDPGFYQTANISTASSFEIGAHVDSGTNQEFIVVLWQNNSMVDGCFWDSYGFDLSSTSKWTHVVFTYNGTLSGTSRGNLYVNGKAFLDPDTGATSCAGTISDVTSTDQSSLGIGQFNSNFYDGQLDDFKIFNYVLTPTQVKTEYTGGAVRFN